MVGVAVAVWDRCGCVRGGARRWVPVVALVSCGSLFGLTLTPAVSGATGRAPVRHVASTSVKAGSSPAPTVYPRTAHPEAKRAVPGYVVVTVTPFTESTTSHTLGAAAVQPATTSPQPPFAECPPVGNDTSCQVFVQVGDGADNVYKDPAQGPFDGSEDALVGVLNSSSSTVTSLAVSSNTPALFRFDNDGLCSVAHPPTPSGCPFGPTGYEGPGVSFTGINSNQSGGTVNFSSGIAPGASGYFSLENDLTTASIFAGGPSVPEQGGAQNPSEKSTTCPAGDPVNCGTGELSETYADLSIAGRGVAIDFTRTYNGNASSIDANGPFGWGWTDSYAMSLSFDGFGNVTVNQENGSTVSFADQSGTYVAFPRVLAGLSMNADGTYTFVRDAQQVDYLFSAAGQLLAETDRNGYTTTLSYTAGQLSAITDPAGRTLSLSYSGNHITGITDPAGRHVTYSYNADSELTGVIDVDGGTTGFGYDYYGDLTTVTDPRGGVTTNTYNSSANGIAQVTSQVDPAGRTTTWTYSGDNVSSAGGQTVVADPEGNLTIYDYQNLELLSVTRGAGTPAVATWSYSYDPATLGVATSTDPDGHTTSFTYDGAGNQLVTTDALGHTMTRTYNAFNEVSSVTDPMGINTSYTYDANSNTLTKTVTGAGGSWQ